jgi:16S rRNA (guanine(966)-N(2))-methyltransferase RsmD
MNLPLIGMLPYLVFLMRIISGKYKGRKIIPPSNLKARPTTDFAKEGLFDILNHRIDFESVNVLDLFSGTGYLSYEFASRGAISILAVEVNALHASFIRKTAKEFQMPIKVVEANAFLYLRRLKSAFDIIFCDPPYDLKGIETLPSLVFPNSLLTDDGLLIIEHGKQVSFLGKPYFLHQRNYGKVQFSFFSKNADKYFFR